MVFDHKMNRLVRGAFLVLLVIFIGAAQASEPRKLVIHVPQDNPKSWKQTLNMASNLPKILGMDNVAIEIVAQGPGLQLLTDKSPMAERVTSLAMQDITFSACGMTMKGIEKKTGKRPVLLEGVGEVPGGILRVMDLQEAGYSYARP